MVVVYACDTCPLAFRVGGYQSWKSPGGEEQVVCTGCGTMHRLVQNGKLCRVLALPGPAREVDAAHPPESAWKQVGTAADRADWRRLRCGVCRKTGLLRSRERLPRQTEYPEEPVCPLCGRPLRFVMGCISH